MDLQFLILTVNNDQDRLIQDNVFLSALKNILNCYYSLEK
jgi:hypothetical protein